MKRALILAATLGALLMAGCSAHYRQALRDYQRNEPTRFLRETLEWSKAADTGTSRATWRATGAETLARGAAPSSGPIAVDSGEAFLEMAAEVLNAEPDVLAERLKRFRDSKRMEAILTENLSWKDLIHAVALRSPAVRAAQEQWQATINQYDQAAYLENLVAEYRTFTRYLNIETGEPLHQQMVQAFFPYPSAIALKGEVVREQVRAARFQWQRALRDSVVQAGLAFHEVQYLGRAQKATEENIALVQNLVQVIEDRYRTGSATQGDLLKVQTELARQRKMLVDLRAQMRARMAEINALLDRASDALLGPPENADQPDVSISLSKLTKTALERRQEILAQQAAIAAMRSEIRMGEVMNRPLATQGYSLFERGTGPEASAGPSSSSGMAGSPQPRPAYAQAESFLAEMRRRLQAEESMLQAMVNETRALAESSLADLDVARREAALIREIVLPQNQSTYETVMASYTAGQTPFLDLLDAERELIRSRLELHAAQRDWNQALVRLMTVAGKRVASER